MGYSRALRYAAALALVLSSSGALAAGDLYCKFTEKFQCTPGGGCKAAKPNVYTFVYPGRNEYSRCENGDCDTFTFVRSGDDAGFVTIELPGRGAIAKIGPDKTIAEIVTLGRFVLVSYGQCEPGPPPIVRDPK